MARTKTKHSHIQRISNHGPVATFLGSSLFHIPAIELLLFNHSNEALSQPLHFVLGAPPGTENRIRDPRQSRFHRAFIVDAILS
jgi:hypothetical protein